MCNKGLFTNAELLCDIRSMIERGTSVAQSVKHVTLDLSIGLDLRAKSSRPTWRLPKKQTNNNKNNGV